MSSGSERLERLIETELGECCDGDVEDRIDTLTQYATDVPSNADSDLRALQTLGNETRFTIARLLDAADQELCVCEITPIVDVSESAISHALSDLAESGLVSRRKDGNWRYYEVTDRASALLDALDATREAER